MAGPGDPPEGTPEGVPGGSEEEFRSVVFDESFIRAARLQENSARERITDHAPAVRKRVVTPHAAAHRRLSLQALVMIVLIAVAFAVAIYMGVRQPYSQPESRPADPLRMTVIPLSPQGPVPGGKSAAELFENSPAAEFGAGASGMPFPAVYRTAHFSADQVRSALDVAKNYLVASSLDPAVLTGAEIRPVRRLIDPDQLQQFDAGLDRPAADGRHAPSGWLVRFDPAKVALAGDEVRVNGTLKAAETSADTLEVTSHHTFVYALRPVAGDDSRVSLFTVRRELHFRFDKDNLRVGQVELTLSYLQAGPLSCGADSADRLRPLLAGQSAASGGPAGTDPYATGGPTALCGALAASAQPTPPRR
ncbi:hypothetical protein H9Y04_27430 [Streptomyces sp. TRM66268-LWL]|uniref:Uncharacterized protein n=1 Tax=Streptomyces polyasparticus TaxID=2767826 RepID=A0ABR7SN48_9ACTN|nr:hypothetical protein [Streptomyces polyasparticus]MBC9716274.1 hypothetical protein [Streptomyces polyasparticus]